MAPNHAGALAASPVTLVPHASSASMSTSPGGGGALSPPALSLAHSPRGFMAARHATSMGLSDTPMDVTHDAHARASCVAAGHLPRREPSSGPRLRQAATVSEQAAVAVGGKRLSAPTSSERPLCTAPTRASTRSAGVDAGGRCSASDAPGGGSRILAMSMSSILSRRPRSIAPPSAGAGGVSRMRVMSSMSSSRLCPSSMSCLAASIGSCSSGRTSSSSPPTSSASTLMPSPSRGGISSMGFGLVIDEYAILPRPSSAT
mmetsp:Transcript_11963/g.50348  ORF Transcript_11963/g.50348 Transcript_11963/m.50348 type:complete len:260 (+) Transcript_11963:973-1752(+)